MFTPSLTVARAVAAMIQLGLAAGHLVLLPAGFRAVPYIGVAHVGLLLAALVGAAISIGSPTTGVWWYAALVGVAHIVGYAETRLVGLPLFHRDVGHWFQPLALLGVFFGGVLLALALWSLTALARPSERLPRGDRYSMPHRS